MMIVFIFGAFVEKLEPCLQSLIILSKNNMVYTTTDVSEELFNCCISTRRV